MTKLGRLLLAVLLVGANPGSAHGGGGHGAKHGGGSGSPTGVGHRNWRHDRFRLDYPLAPLWAIEEGPGPGDDRGSRTL